VRAGEGCDGRGAYRRAASPRASLTFLKYASPGASLSRYMKHVVGFFESIRRHSQSGHACHCTDATRAYTHRCRRAIGGGRVPPLHMMMMQAASMASENGHKARSARPAGLLARTAGTGALPTANGARLVSMRASATPCATLCAVRV